MPSFWIGVPIAAFRQLFGDKTAFGAHRHDDRVLDLLGLDQAQDFGAVVLKAVGPAQTAPRHLAAAQMHALHPRRIDKNLEHGQGQRHIRNAVRIELDADVGAWALALLVRLIIIGAQGCLHQVEDTAAGPCLR